MLENTMRQEAIDSEKDRLAKIEQQRQEYKDQRRAEKAKKSKKNAKLAKEVLDLIMDVAEEAFDYQEEQMYKTGMEELTNDLKLDKPTWREWMDIFVEGKRVSEKNAVVAAEEEPKDATTGMDKIGGLGYILEMEEETDPAVVLSRVKHEQIYQDFLQYLCLTGAMNFQ